jgi:hypothetical protein
MLHIEVSIVIHAPQTKVADLYRDYDNWLNVFPTIQAVRLVREDANKTVLAIDHWEGQVVNILTFVSPTQIDLEEFKKRYDARFSNHFEAVPEGTRYLVVADVSLKGIAKLLEPFLGAYVRRQIIRLVLEPIKQSAEAARP